MFSIFFLPWVVLILFAVIAVPVAFKLAPSSADVVASSYGEEYQESEQGGEGDVLADPLVENAVANGEMMMDNMGGEMGDDVFGGDAAPAEPVADDVFEDF